MSTPIPSVEQLRELSLPAPVSYWPQTWGWWLLGALLLAAIVLWAGWRYYRWRLDRYRRDALQRLASLERELAAEPPRLSALRELPELLKRVALSMPGAPPVAPLHSAAWQAFLSQHARRPLPADFASQLAQLAYAPERRLGELDATALLRQTRDWVEHHHVAV